MEDGEGRTRNPYKIAFWLLLAAVVLTPVFFRACSRTLELYGRQELVRLTSPAGKTDAVLVSSGSFGGATSSSGLYLFVVQAGAEAEDLPLSETLLIGEEVDPDLDDGLKLRWRGERALEIRYRAVQVDNFQQDLRKDHLDSGTLELLHEVVMQ